MVRTAMTPATRPQLARLHATLADLAVTERDAKLATLSAVLYRDVRSSRELSLDDARVAIDTLTQIRDGGEAEASLERMVRRYIASAATR